MLVVILAYTKLRNSRSIREKTLDITLKNRKRNGDFAHRSFTAKWHDGRGLLNEISETKKNDNIRAKFVKHLSENQRLDREISHRNDLVLRNQGISDALESLREQQIKGNEVAMPEHERTSKTAAVMTMPATSKDSILRNIGKLSLLLNQILRTYVFLANQIF